MQMNGFKDKKDGALVELSLLGNEKTYEELVIRYEKSVKGTAELVRTRIDDSIGLAYVATSNISDSKWFPWELGYADGKKNGK